MTNDIEMTKEFGKWLCSFKLVKVAGTNLCIASDDAEIRINKKGVYYVKIIGNEVRRFDTMMEAAKFLWRYQSRSIALKRLKKTK